MNTKRSGSGRDLYVTRILRRKMAEMSEIKQQEIADALDCDRSHISHQLSGRFRLSADDLDVWCDHLDTVEPLQAIARRIGMRVVPAAKSSVRVERFLDGFNLLLKESGLAGYTAGGMLADGVLCADDRVSLYRQLEVVRETAEALQALLGGTGEP
jgi:hypothetical protein